MQHCKVMHLHDLNRQKGHYTKWQDSKQVTGCQL